VLSVCAHRSNSVQAYECLKMKLLPNISKTIFHSFIFALGGAPTIAMWLSTERVADPELFFSAFISLTVLLACVLLPIIFIQNIFLLIKRQSPIVEDKVAHLSWFYLILNVICLIYWLLRVANLI